MNLRMLRAASTALVSALLLAGCGLFGGSRDEVSEEERAERISLSVLDQKLTADPALAETEVVLPPPVSTDWPQKGGAPGLAIGHVEAAPEFRVDWRASIGEGSSRHKRIVAAPVAAGGRIFTIDAAQDVSAPLRVALH